MSHQVSRYEAGFHPGWQVCALLWVWCVHVSGMIRKAYIPHGFRIPITCFCCVKPQGISVVLTVNITTITMTVIMITTIFTVPDTISDKKWLSI